MLSAKNKQLKFILLCIIATLFMASGCTDEEKRNAAILTGAIRSGIAQTIHSQSLYQRPDWKAEDYFDDPKVVALCQAIRKRDIALVDKLIAEGADVNAKGEGNMTPLLWAFVQGRPWNKAPSLANQNKPGVTEKWATEEFDATHLAIFTKLLEHGADPNVQFTDTFFEVVVGITPVESHKSITRIAIDSLPFPYFEAVMKNGGVPHLFSEMNRERYEYEDFTVRVASMAMKRADLLKKLQHVVDAGVDLNSVDDRGLTPLMQAVSYGAYDQACLLVEAGADWLVASPKEPNFLAPIVATLVRKDVQTPSYQRLVEILEEKGADFDLEREIRRTPRGEDEMLRQQRRELYKQLQQKE